MKIVEVESKCVAVKVSGFPVNAVISAAADMVYPCLCNTSWLIAVTPAVQLLQIQKVYPGTTF